MTKRKNKSNEGVIILYRLNYDKLWWFHNLTDSWWLVLTLVGLMLIRVDSCWTHPDTCWTRIDSCWTCIGLVLTRVGLVLACFELVVIGVDSGRAGVDMCWLLSDLGWFVLTFWYSCTRIELITISQGI